MDPATKPRRPARFTLPVIGLVALAIAGGHFLKRSSNPDEAAILGMASERGILPLAPHPRVGMAIYQWDPELHDIAPFFIGAVIDADSLYRGKHYTLVKRPHSPGLFIDVKPGDNRYWMEKGAVP